MIGSRALDLELHHVALHSYQYSSRPTASRALSLMCTITCFLFSDTFNACALHEVHDQNNLDYAANTPHVTMLVATSATRQDTSAGTSGTKLGQT